jgi:hypothetical protein
MADYGDDSPVWSEHGRMTLDELRISEELRHALVEWQEVACDDRGQREHRWRTEVEWTEAGQRLAERLSAETGLSVEFVD